VSNAPQEQVLTDAIVEAIGDARLRVAVFLTYQLQPMFFQDHILAPLLGVDDAGNPRVRRMLVEEELRGVDTLLLYDRHAVEPDGPLQQPVLAVPVERSQGLLHAKHVLLLVEHPEGAEPSGQALVLVTTSANLTRSGWWENVEVADVRVLHEASETPLAEDLVTLVDDIATLAGSRPRAVQRLTRFAATLRPTTGLPRLWLGREPLPAFLARHGVPRGADVELLAPFVGQDGQVVTKLHRTLAPRTTRVFLPLARDEKGAASTEWHRGVAALHHTKLARIAVERSLGKGEGHRFVHAKAIRVTTEKHTWELVGSPNLTAAAHGGWRATPSANIETAILTRGPTRAPWLLPLGTTDAAPPADSSHDDLRPAGIALRLRICWEPPIHAEARLPEGESHTRVHIGPGVQTSPPTARLELDLPTAGAWHPLTEDQLAQLQEELQATNVLTAWTGDEAPRAFLVEEHGLAFRASRVFAELTPADILAHWALLSPERRAAHVEAILGTANLDGEAPVDPVAPARRTCTFFDDTAGLLHAFLMLGERLQRALDDGTPTVLTDILLGERHDSLGTLLDKVVDEQAEDPVRRVLVAESSLALLERFTGQPAVADHPEACGTLRDRIRTVADAWTALDLGEDGDAFRRWFCEQWGSPWSA